MFENLQMAPPDAILGLTDTFNHDPSPHKINLTVGVYKDAQGHTPILNCVKEAEKRLLADEQTKGYLGIDGLADYGRLVRELAFGADHPLLAAGRAATVQTPGGTAAVRVAADFLKSFNPGATVWCSKPTWANHPSIFQAAGLPVEQYAYLDAAGTGLDFAAMRAALEKIPAGDAVCLHACCHNPTGVDPTAEQWREIAHLVRARGILPLVDFAYQGFGEGLREDACGLLALCAADMDMLVCSSFSKNFGLYGERVGALSIIASSSDAAQRALSHAKTCVRANYSNPPKHGAAIVAAILADDALRALWEEELECMRSRIHLMRELFVKTMKAKRAGVDFSFISRQRGMFSYSGLTPLQVDRLRNEFSIYIVGSGRINVAGMSEENMGRLCDAIAAVL